MARSRTKGKAYECYIAKLFKAIGFPNAKRHLEFQSQEAVRGRDLDGTQPFAVQAKCWQKTPSISNILDVQPDDEYAIPVLVLKRTRSPGIPTIEVAVVDLGMFMQMVNILKENDLLDGLG